jgi:DNA-directed RNA polymerase beta subunit
VKKSNFIKEGFNLKIVNPHYKIRDEDNNIFMLRRKDYERILPVVQEIVQPVEEIGFSIDKVEMKSSRNIKGELSKTLYSILQMKFSKGSSLIELKLYIPKLIDNNYMFINGRKKIPLFQLFDVPIVMRGEKLKMRTNVGTLLVYSKKDSPYVVCGYLGKRVPFALILMAFYGPETLKSMFQEELTRITKQNEPEDNIYDRLLFDIKMYFNESIGYTQDDFIKELGKLYTKYNTITKGNDIIYSLDLIPKVDIFTREFLETGSILEDIILGLKRGEVDDTILQNKRIRCFEYVIYSSVCKIIFDMCLSNRDIRKPKFNTNTKQLITASNVSEIVQFDFSINPIDKLTKLSRASLLGPGGFRRENIPRHLRDIYPTMFGRMCPVDTPDRENCGVLQNLIPNVPLDNNMRFTDSYCEKQPISIPVSFIPFCEHDDQTRLQMASSQMRQAILLKEFDKPIIQSGCEHLYTKYTDFIKMAPKNGEVLYLNEQYMVVLYEDKTGEVFDISSRKIYVHNVDIMRTYFKEGEHFKAGDILAESDYCKDGDIIFGKNFLTGIMIHYGYNYEDGIVISDKLSKSGALTSVHFIDLSFTMKPDRVLLDRLGRHGVYEPLPTPNTLLEPGDVYARMQKLTTEDHFSEFHESTVLETPKRVLITDVKIYANTWNNDVPIYREWIENFMQKQIDDQESLRNVVMKKLPEDISTDFVRDHLHFDNVGKYKIKKEKIDGIHIEMYGIQMKTIKVGDKIGNRHGNKGVISTIMPENKMPQLEDGRHLDICMNPLGILSRMNIGQLYELHLGMAVNDLKTQALHMLEAGDKAAIRDYLIDFIKIIDKTEGWYLDQFVEKLPDEIDEKFLEDFSVIQPPFQSIKVEDLKAAMEYTNTKFKYKVFDPPSQKMVMSPISVGYVYFFRMTHIADDKLAARGIGSYAKRTLQPLGGRKNKGGQRCGEMETACFIGHDAMKNLHEMFTLKSDCFDTKNNYIKNLIDPQNIIETDIKDPIPESVRLLNSYLTVLGVDHRGKDYERTT